MRSLKWVSLDLERKKRAHHTALTSLASTLSITDLSEWSISFSESTSVDDGTAPSISLDVRLGRLH